MAEDQDPNVDPTTDPDDNDPDDGGEWTPPTREEWEKAQRTMAARKRERDDARREAAQLRDGVKPKADPADPAAGKAEEKAAAREESDNRARRAAGIAALVEAGLTRAAAKEAIPLLKLKGLEVDADGDVDEEGLADAVAAMKERFPGMFPGRKSSRQRTADGGGPRGGTKSATDRTTDALLRQAGFARD